MPRRSTDAGDRKPVADAQTQPAQADKGARFQGKTLADWLVLLRDEQQPARLASAKALGQAGHDPDEPGFAVGLQALAHALQDEDETVRFIAAESLDRYGPCAAAVLLAVIKESKDDRVRRDAAGSLSGRRGGSCDAATVAAIGELLLGDRDARVRACAASALGDIGRPAVPVLASALQSEDRDVRLSALHALWRMYPRTRKAAPPLIGVLTGDDEELRVAAARALGDMGDEAGEALPALLEASKADDDLGPAARDALQKIHKAPRSAAPALIGLLKDAEPHVRLKAAEVLCEMEEGDEECLAALLELIKRRDTKVRQQSALLLARYGSAARGAVPALVEVVRNDPDGQTRRAAVAALGAVGPDARPAVPALRAALAGVPQSGDKHLEWAIQAALIKIQEEDPPAAG